jgi:hypothetical protein
LDFAPTRRLVVAGAGAGAGAGAASTDWLRFLAPRRGAFIVSASWSAVASCSDLAAGVATAFVPRTVLRVDLPGSAASLSVVVDPLDFVAVRERRTGPGSGARGSGLEGGCSGTSGVTTFFALVEGLVGAVAVS